MASQSYLRRYAVIVTLLSAVTVFSLFTYNQNLLKSNMTHKFKKTSPTTAQAGSNLPPPMSRHWQQVSSNPELYVFSAYHKEEENIVQIIGIASPYSHTKCICVFPSNKTSREDKVNGELEIIPEEHGEANSAVFIKCSLKNTTSNPTTVGIRVGNDTKYLQVIYASPRRYNFTVCASCLHGIKTDQQDKYSEHTRLIEMVEADRMFGADHFIVYNYSVSPEVDRILRHYRDAGIMEVIQWNLPTFRVWYFGQLAYLQDCNLVSRNRSKYLVQKDVDELIVPRKHQTWHGLMAELDSEGSKGCIFLFRNMFFQLTWEPDIDDFKNAYGAVVLNLKSLLYVFRDSFPNPARIRSKYIVRPELVYTLGIHFSWKKLDGCQTHEVKTDVAALHHYRGVPSPTHGKVKDTYMRVFASELIKRVNKTYLELRYISNDGVYRYPSLESRTVL